MNVEIPYGRTKLVMEADEKRVITSRIGQLPKKDGTAEVEKALQNPIGSPKLSELARGKKDAVIIISDHTRPVPSRCILPPMLRELRAGNPEIKVTLLVATGCHRAMTKEELRAKLGDEILDHEKIVVHDCDGDNVEIGALPSGARLVLDRLAVETELLVAEGFIEPHFFAGFSGGRKSVLPGLCDRKTVLGNHCGEFIASEYARTGVLEGNPIHRDMVAAAEMAKLAFIVNVVIDEEHDVSAAFAGHFNEAHLAGVDFLRKYCEVDPIPGDIVITSNGGVPLDQNLYQTVKGLTAAEASAKPGATIIMCSDMGDGIGGDSFYRSLSECTDVGALYEQYSQTPMSETIVDQWQSQVLLRVLMKHRVIYVTRPEMRQALLDMHMEYAPDIDTALAMAGEGEVTVIPNGISVVVKTK